MTRSQIMYIYPIIGTAGDKKIAKAMEWFHANGIEPRDMKHIETVAEML